MWFTSDNLALLYAHHSSPARLLRQWARDIQSAYDHGDEWWALQLIMLIPNRDWRLYLP